MSTELEARLRAVDMSNSLRGRLLRRQAGLSLREVAAECGTTATSVFYWETGRYQPKSEAGVRWGNLMAALEERSLR